MRIRFIESVYQFITFFFNLHTFRSPLWLNRVPSYHFTFFLTPDSFLPTFVIDVKMFYTRLSLKCFCFFFPKILELLSLHMKDFTFWMMIHHFLSQVLYFQSNCLKGNTSTELGTPSYESYWMIQHTVLLGTRKQDYQAASSTPPSPFSEIISKCCLTRRWIVVNFRIVSS